MVKKALLMDEKDTVATVIDNIMVNDSVEILYDGKVVQQITSISDFDAYHKIALADYPPDIPMYKYGEIIGRTTQAIRLGEHVHVNNIDSVMTK